MKKQLHFFKSKAKYTLLLALTFGMIIVNTMDAQIKMTGTLIGTAGSWASDPTATKEAAVDGDINSFFDGPSSNSWIGYDYVTNGALLTSIKYYPRNSNTTTLPDRMQGNKVYGSNIGGNDASPADAVLLFTFPNADTGSHLEGQYDYRAVAASGLLDEFVLSPAPTESYRYIYMTSSNGCNVGEIEFYGTLSTLGVEDLVSLKSEIKLYPNPSTNNSFNIEFGKGYNNNISSVKIYSILGSLVLDKAVNANTNKITINHNLKSGIYMVKLNDYISKLIVK